ncbi:MAG: hypothetical protein ABII00_03950 [Elusimicrobiota bacterium]
MTSFWAKASLLGILACPPAAALDIPQDGYRESLSAEDKRIYDKLEDLGAFKSDGPTLHASLRKRRGKFYLEGFAAAEADFEDARPVLKDFKGYAKWVLDRINRRRRGGRPGYLFSLHGLGYDEAKRRLDLQIELDKWIKGRYILRLKVRDGLSEPALPELSLELWRPTRLVSGLRGDFKFFAPPGEKRFVCHFLGEARLHWLPTHMVPMRFFRIDVEERIQTILENGQRRLGAGPGPKAGHSAGR